MQTKNDYKVAVAVLEERRKEVIALLYTYEHLLDELEDQLIDIDRDLDEFRFTLSKYRSEEGKWSVVRKKNVEINFYPKQRIWEEP